MPCVPMAQTPSSKGFVGTVADFAPNTSPMIPALVIYCINEESLSGNFSFLDFFCCLQSVISKFAVQIAKINYATACAKFAHAVA